MYHHSSWGLFWLIALVVQIVPFWRICARVGLSRWLGILAAIPLVNLIFFYFLAFSEWPSHKGGVPPAQSPGAGPV